MALSPDGRNLLAAAGDRPAAYLVPLVSGLRPGPAGTGGSPRGGGGGRLQAVGGGQAQGICSVDWARALEPAERAGGAAPASSVAVTGSVDGTVVLRMLG
jgi:hypothetical protein